LGTLVLVRHAQASFLADNYDKLSSLGETQSTLLGGYLLNMGRTFDRVFVGPRDRQQKTAALVARVYQDAGVPLPEAKLTPALDEYQGEQLLKKSLPRLMSSDVHLQTLAAEFAESEQEDVRVRAKTFQKMFEHVMRAWVNGVVDEEGVEPWVDFRRRIANFVDELKESTSKGESVIAFTSGGSIAGVVQCALELNNVQTVEMSWMVKNSSLTELAFNPKKLTLSSFNAIPHLQSERLITYR
jgi:broad specificity phosphatase PhoE